MITCGMIFILPTLPFPSLGRVCRVTSERRAGRQSAVSLCMVFTELLVKPRPCGSSTHTRTSTELQLLEDHLTRAVSVMMDSGIEVTGSADSAYYSHQSFESDLSCDLSETSADRAETLQGEQGMRLYCNIVNT